MLEAEAQRRALATIPRLQEDKNVLVASFQSFEHVTSPISRAVVHYDYLFWNIHGVNAAYQLGDCRRLVIDGDYD